MGIEVTANHLVEAYASNEQGARRTYSGHWVSVTGEIAEVGETKSPQAFVTLKNDGTNVRHLRVVFSDDGDDVLTDLERDQSITVTCKVSVVRSEIILRNCALRSISSLQ